MENDKRVAQQPRRRDDRPKVNPKEDYGYRIRGLEQTKLEPGMSPADIAALDRVIAKLKEKLATQKEPKPEDKEDRY
jgi:hypothetical protein